MQLQTRRYFFKKNVCEAWTRKYMKDASEHEDIFGNTMREVGIVLKSFRIKIL